MSDAELYWLLHDILCKLDDIEGPGNWEEEKRKLIQAAAVAYHADEL